MAFDRSEPCADNQFQAAHARLIVLSYARVTGRELLQSDPADAAFGRDLYHAPFVVLAHDRAQDPVFFYANLAAQGLFKFPWADFVALPSRLSAEPMVRDERQGLLERVHKHGFVDDYSGVRIARDGTRFDIKAAVVWNLTDARGALCGQAAAFDNWSLV